jgi:predicted phosphoadenosine phosphosulfate sulfurtransferase
MYLFREGSAKKDNSLFLNLKEFKNDDKSLMFFPEIKTGKWFYEDGIPDESPWELESINKAPAWRRIVRTLLRNDYWCKGMGFSPTKNKAYEKYMNLMRKRRKEWNIFSEEVVGNE